MSRVFAITIFLILACDGGAIPIKEAPLYESILQKAGARTIQAARNKISWEMDGTAGMAAINFFTYYPSMEPGYKISQPPRNMTKKQADEYIKQLKLPKAIGFYVQGVMLASKVQEDKNGLAIQKLASSTLSNCFNFGSQQLSVVQSWWTTNWGKDAKVRIGTYNLNLIKHRVQGYDFNFIAINFDDFGENVPNLNGWDKFCRIKM